MTTIRDAVHGDVELTEEETAIIDTPTMQRLRGIKQLGTSNLVYPSAVHTRFEHSLGTCWIAKRMLDALSRSGVCVDEEQRRTICLAALLHDVTHVPYGHTFEDERRLFDRHDEDIARLDRLLGQAALARSLAATGLKDRVRAVLAGADDEPPLARPLITGTVCADLLDYLKRDALFTGLSLDYDERLFRYFHVDDGRLVVRLHKDGVFRRDALSELVHLLQIRYSLTERVYYHHAKVVAGAMISRALELALASEAIRREELYELRDDSLLQRLSSVRDVAGGVGDVLDDLMSRRLYKRVYLLTVEGLGMPGLSTAQRDGLAARFHSDLAQRSEMERTIAAELGIPEAHVILYCPSPHMALKEADVPVEVAPGNVRALSELKHPDVSALTEKHRGLWRFYVCLRRDHEPQYRRAGRVCEVLIGHTNQLEPQAKGKLAFGR